MKLKDKNEVKEVNTSKFKKTKVISNLRLGIRNTFNIVPKFLLLTFVYLFVLISIVGVYSAFLELESTNNTYNSFFNETDANKRVIVKKKDNSSFTNEEINKLKSISNVEKVITNDYVYDYNMSLIDYENIFLDSNFVYEVLDDFKPIFEIINIPLDILPMAILRPISGTATLAIMNDIFINYGPDSYTGRLASVLQGCTDTTIYVLALYFGSVGVKKIRYSLSVGLIADLIGITVAFILSSLLIK